jgi:hypothetical protein
MNRSLFVFSLSLIVLCCTAQNPKMIRLDNSDWWSVLKDDSVGPVVKPKKQALSPRNFQIAGIDLGTDFQKIVSKLGPSQIVERGDASTGRQQLCYRSDGIAGRTETHLIFEFGEVGSVAYLFNSERHWNGSNFCAHSKIDLNSVHTNMGLKLGLRPHQVVSILGRPDLARSGTFFYVREFKRKTTPQEFEQMRSNYSENVDDNTAHQMFDFYDVEMYVEARFTQSKLTYLAMSQSETD